MGKTLHSLCREYLKEKNFLEIETDDLAKFVFHNKFDKSEVIFFISKFSKLEIYSFTDYLYFLRKVLCLVIIAEDQKEVFESICWDDLIKKMNKTTNFDQIQIVQALKYLIFYLLKKDFSITDPLQLPHLGLVVSKGYYYPWSQLPNLQLNCELCSLWAIIGILTKNKQFINSSENLADWLYHLLDKDGFPMIGAWSQESSFNNMEILVSYYMMSFTIGSCVDSHYKDISEKILVHIQEMIMEQRVFVSSFSIFLTKKIDEISKQNYLEVKEDQLKEQKFIDPSIGMITSKGKNFDSVMTLRGLNSGIGSFHCKDVRIVSFGPQYFPLSDSRGYGIYRLASYSNDNKKDFICCDDGNQLHLRGWTRLSRFSEQENEEIEVEPSSLWQEIEGRIDQDRLCISLDFPHQELSEKIALSCYIQAKTCFVKDEEYLCRSLNRYCGEAKEVSLRGKLASIRIKSNYIKKMHVIPLGGQKNFWNSHFLLAYEIDPIERKCFLEIVKD